MTKGLKPRANQSRSVVTETLRVPTSMLKRLIETAPRLPRRKISKGHSVYGQGEPGDHLYVIISGRLGITMIANTGQEVLIDIVGPGALCGEGPVFNGLPRFSGAGALEPAEVLAIPGSEFLNLWRRMPSCRHWSRGPSRSSSAPLLVDSRR